MSRGSEWKKANRGPEYNVWSEMKNRCFNPNSRIWKHYGGRGITVCERWLKYANFIEDMGNRPTSKHTLDRINNDGNYELGNCRWATRDVQSRNTSRNILIKHNGKEQCLMDWSKELGINYFTLRTRRRLGTDLFAPITPYIENLRRR